MSSHPIAGLWGRVASLAASLGLLGLAGGQAVAEDAAAGATQTVYLEYQEVGSRINGWRLNLTRQAESFRKEPDWGGRHICRGTINSAFRGVEKPGAPPGHAINLPFAWDYRRGNLHLDSNRNGDLTDDPVCSTPPDSGGYSYQTFTNLHLAIAGQAQSHRVLADLALYGYQGKDVNGGNLTWRSFWQGKAVLGGREWQVGLIEHPNHLGSTAEGYLLLRPWEERAKPFNLEDGLLAGFEYGTNLFAQGRAYRLSCTYLPGGGAKPGRELRPGLAGTLALPPGDAPKYKLELTEQPAELGEVELSGKFIQRVVLREHQAKVPYTVVLDGPGPKVRIPIGTYRKYWAALKEKDAEAFCHHRDWLNPRPVTITGRNVAMLPMGGPLTNWVSIEGRGRTLSLEHELLGAGGRYRLAGPADRSKPPEFAIYQNGRPVASGKFAYG